MFGKYLRKNKKRVFLDFIGVFPDETRLDEYESLWSNKIVTLESDIKKELEEIFFFQPISQRVDELPNDCALQVLVPKFVQGDASILLLDIPYISRPKIQIFARLYSVKSGKTLMSTKVTEKMNWNLYLDRAISLRTIFPFKPLFDLSDFKPLIFNGCHKVLQKIDESI